MISSSLISNLQYPNAKKLGAVYPLVTLSLYGVYINREIQPIPIAQASLEA